jgi:recombination protein RecT
VPNNNLIQKQADVKNQAIAERKPQSPANMMKGVLSTGSVRQLFENVLQKNAEGFISGVIDLYASDTYLQKCDPAKVAMEALKAATLKLPINKQLGFAYVVPYKDVPQFQIGYKGYIQLAMRTAAYRHINADLVYESELKTANKLTGEIDLSGERTGDKVVGYFAYIETLNGFSKTIYMTVEAVTAWAKRYSKSFSYGNSAWSTNFDEMALKTCLRRLISKWGIMSVEMVSAFEAEDMAELADAQINSGAASGDVVQAEFKVMVDEDTGEVVDGTDGAQP